jgi:hypothetical protein
MGVPVANLYFNLRNKRIKEFYAEKLMMSSIPVKKVLSLYGRDKTDLRVRSRVSVGKFAVEVDDIYIYIYIYIYICIHVCITEIGNAII